MKIAYLFSRYPKVSHTFCDTEMLALERAGCELEVVVLHPPLNAFRHEHAAELQAPIFHAPPPPVMRALEARARRQGRFPEALVREHEARFGAAFKPAERARNAVWLAEHLTRRGVTHLHVHFANRAAHTALFVQELCGLPFSFTAHGQDFMADLGNAELLCEMGKRAAFVVWLSEYSRELLARTCPALGEKVRLIYNGMDLRQFPARPAPKNEVPRMVSVGRLVPVKGHEHLIEAWAQLRARGVPFAGEIVGDGPERERLQRAIDQRALGGQVTLAGRLSQAEVFQRLAHAEIFALPSIVEAQGATDILPTVVLEAMATARAVVATNVGGVVEMVEEGVTGLLVPPGEPGKLAEALEGLLRDADRREAMGAAGRARVERDFRVEQGAAALRELFGQLERPVEDRPETAPAAPGYAYLVPEWPPRALPGLPRELRELRARHPRLRILVGRVATGYVAPAAEEDLLAELEFLPDAMVLEAEWLQERALARRIESWWQELPMPSTEYLEQGRWAVQLRRILGSGVRHLHVAGSAALPAGWMLRRLANTTFSATVEPKPVFPAAALAQLLAAAVGGRMAETGQALPERFEPDRIAAPGRWEFLDRSGAALRAWEARLKGWAAGRQE